MVESSHGLIILTPTGIFRVERGRDEHNMMACNPGSSPLFHPRGGERWEAGLLAGFRRAYKGARRVRWAVRAKPVNRTHAGAGLAAAALRPPSVTIARHGRGSFSFFGNYLPTGPPGGY